METDRQHLIGFDTIVMILLTLASLELNIPYVLDQLDFHKAMSLMGPLRNLLSPAGLDNPLVIMGNLFMPLKLMIRTLSLAAIIAWCVADISRARATAAIHRSLVLFLILLHVLLPMTLLIIARVGSDNHALAHDGGTIQMEEAMKMVLKGQNPYSETFEGTPLENWRGFSNHIVFHVPYMPGAFLYSIPPYLLIKHLTGIYDQRILHIGLFMISLFLIDRLSISGRRRNIALLAFALNPFFARYFMLGTNDIVVIICLLASLALIDHRWYRSGLAALAAACCIKQFAWFFVPFLLAVSIDLDPGRPREWIRTLHKNAGRWIPGALLAALTILPFLLVNPQTFWDDTVRYSSGGLPTSYPMQGFHGYGFATVLLFTRWVPDGSARFPFGLLQAVVVIPLFLWLWHRFTDTRNLPAAITYAAITLLPFMFFSRYLHGNFIGFIVLWPILGWCMDRHGEPS
ncbi:DUF2029 domain-containing protein [bacterium]|nr:DUF2029 domain-containing protein [candidate division CSSED10-310 bacterium]